MLKNATMLMRRRKVNVNTIGISLRRPCLGCGVDGTDDCAIRTQSIVQFTYSERGSRTSKTILWGRGKSGTAIALAIVLLWRRPALSKEGK